MIQSIVFGTSSVLLGESVIRQTRKSAEKYVYVCLNPEELPNLTKDQLLPLVHNNMRSFASFFVVGSAVFGLGIFLLASPLITCYKKSDSDKEQCNNKNDSDKARYSVLSAGKIILGTIACIARLYFALRPPQELLFRP